MADQLSPDFIELVGAGGLICLCAFSLVVLAVLFFVAKKLMGRGIAQQERVENLLTRQEQAVSRYEKIADRIELVLSVIESRRNG